MFRRSKSGLLGVISVTSGFRMVTKWLIMSIYAAGMDVHDTEHGREFRKYVSVYEIEAC